MDIEKAKECYKDFQLKQKEKRDEALLQTYIDLEKTIIEKGNKSFQTKFYMLFSDKEWKNLEKIDMKEFFDRKVFIQDCGGKIIINDGETTFEFFYQNFTSRGFKVSFDYFYSDRKVGIILSGWADDE